MLVKGKEIDRVEGNLSVLLKKDKIWAIVSGEADLFLVNIVNDEPQGIRKRVFSAKNGEILIGTDFNHQQGILATGIFGTRMVEISKDEFENAGREYPEEAAKAIEEWFEKLWASSGQEYIPEKARDLEADAVVDISGDMALKPKDRFLWFAASGFKVTGEGAGGTEVDISAEYFPVGRHSWVKVSGEGTIKSVPTESILAIGDFCRHIFKAANILAELLKLTRKVHEANDIDRFNRKKVSDAAVFDISLKSLMSVISRKIKVVQTIGLTRPIYDAAAMVCSALNMKIAKMPQNYKSLDDNDLLEEISRLTRIRTRKVALRDDWWVGDNGPLLAFLKEGSKPVALLPLSHNRYELHDPETGELIEMDSEAAGRLEPFAYVFYRPFPAKALTVTEVLLFGFKNSWKKDLVVVLLAGSTR